jgi:hypothetical protein
MAVYEIKHSSSFQFEHRYLNTSLYLLVEAARQTQHESIKHELLRRFHIALGNSLAAPLAILQAVSSLHLCWQGQ